MSQLQRVAIALEQIQGQHILLTPDQWHYLSRVLRLKPGDRFIVIDPRGRWWQAVLQDNYGQLLEPIAISTELPATMTLIAAMPKGSGFEQIVRQTTELGVSAIYPVMSDRTLLKPSSQKIQRWRRIAQEAAEQSERQVVPTIFEPISFCECLDRIDRSSLVPESNSSNNTNSLETSAVWQEYSHSTQYYICVARGDAPHLLNAVMSTSPKADRIPQIFIATGPEGGWTSTEIEQAISAGFHPVSLGRRILRSMTAPVAAVSLVAAYLDCDRQP